MARRFYRDARPWVLKEREKALPTHQRGLVRGQEEPPESELQVARRELEWARARLKSAGGWLPKATPAMQLQQDMRIDLARREIARWEAKVQELEQAERA